MGTHTMKNTQNAVDMAALIAQAVAQALAAHGIGTEAKAVPAKSAKPALTRGTPALTRAAKPSAKQAHGNADVDPNTVTLVVSHASDNRVKLPARMMDKNGHCWVSGQKFTGQPNDGGRCKVQPSFFDADAGDVITLTRTQGAKWDFKVAGSGKARKQAHKTASAIAEKTLAKKPAVSQPKAKPSLSKKPAVKDNSEAVKALVEKTAALAIAGYNAGRENANLAENDARRFLRTRDKKAFNVGTNALGVKLPDAIKMLSKAVFD